MYLPAAAELPLRWQLLIICQRYTRVKSKPAPLLSALPGTEGVEAAGTGENVGIGEIPISMYWYWYQPLDTEFLALSY